MTLPKATHRGVFMLGNVQMVCYVLDNGQQVFDETSFLELMRRMNDGTWTLSELDALQAAKAMRGVIDVEWTPVRE
jgi:hypothetical protein